MTGGLHVAGAFTQMKMASSISMDARSLTAAGAVGEKPCQAPEAGSNFQMASRASAGATLSAAVSAVVPSGQVEATGLQPSTRATDSSSGVVLRLTVSVAETL